jgi:hypothetical protein
VDFQVLWNFKKANQKQYMNIRLVFKSAKETLVIMSLLFVGYRAIFAPELELFHVGPIEVVMSFGAGVIFFLSLLLHGRAEQDL